MGAASSERAEVTFACSKEELQVRQTTATKYATLSEGKAAAAAHDCMVAGRAGPGQQAEGRLHPGGPHLGSQEKIMFASRLAR